jgi:dolichol kinase
MARELGRKAIHLASALVPVLVWLLPREVSKAVLLPGALLALSIDLARLRWRAPRYHLHRRIRTLLRPHERRRLVGATWMAVAYAFAVWVFPKPVAVAAMLFNGLGDAAAALVGKRWGRHRTRWGKSWEGFAAGLAVNAGVAAAVAALDPRMWLPAALFGALVAAVVELADLPVDDNLRVTLAGGFAILALMAATGRP